MTQNNRDDLTKKDTLVLVPGPPDRMEGRLEREIRVHNLLRDLNIEYSYIDHEMIMDMEGCKEIDRVLEATICKNLFLCNRQKTKFYLLMMPGEKKFHAREISDQINSSRLSFADEEHMLEYLDITPGSVSVMGLMNDQNNHVQLLVDEDILKSEYVGCHPCMNTSSLRIKTEDVFGRFLKAVHHEYRIVRCQ